MVLSCGADVDARGEYGETALHNAASGGAAEVAEVLLGHGADVRAKDKYGETALHKVASGCAAEVVEVLLRYGADVHAKDNYGYTALHEAASYARAEVTEVLLRHGADVHAKCGDGHTPLHLAAWYERSEDSNTSDDVAVMELLLRHGADENATNELVRERSRQQRSDESSATPCRCDPGAWKDRGRSWWRCALRADTSPEPVVAVCNVRRQDWGIRKTTAGQLTLQLGTAQ